MDQHYPMFLWVPGTDGAERMLNLSQVRVIDQISENHIRLMFSETCTVTLSGPIVPELLSLLVNKCCVTSDGSRLPDLLERARSRSQEREQTQAQALES